MNLDIPVDFVKWVMIKHLLQSFEPLKNSFVQIIFLASFTIRIKVLVLVILYYC